MELRPICVPSWFMYPDLQPSSLCGQILCPIVMTGKTFADAGGQIEFLTNITKFWGLILFIKIRIFFMAALGI